jgi:predicted MFS family arabinose efflux permease
MDMTGMHIAENKTGLPAAEPSRERLSHPYVALGAVTVIYTINLLDRQIVNVLAEPIKRDMGLSDTQIGMLAGLVFAVFYTTLGLPLAMLADRVSRVKIIAACCATWSLFTALCGMSANLLQLSLARMGVAIGEAGATPPSYSLIADYFAASKRAMALAIFALASPIASMTGALLAGTIGAAYGWRTALLVASIPGAICAIGFLLLVREPRRGRLDDPAKQNRDPLPLRRFIVEFVRTPLLFRTTVAGAVASFVIYASSTWIPPFLMRERGMTLAQIGAFYGVAVGLSIAAGQLTGGFLGERLARRRSRAALASMSAVAYLVGFPFFVGGILVPSWGVGLPLLLTAGAAAIVYIGPAAALIQEGAAPNQRSLASAIYIFVVNVIGLGLGPLYVGVVSDLTSDVPGIGGLEMAMLSLAPAYLLAAACFWWTAKAIRERA